MMRRVSSRPRLVSDADKAFANATVELSDGLDDSGYADYSSFDQFDDRGDGLNFDDDDHPQAQQTYPPAVAAAAAVSSGDGGASDRSPLVGNLIYDSDETRPPNNDDEEPISESYASSGDLSGYLTCYEVDNGGLPRPPSLLDLQDSFQKKASFVIPAEDDDAVGALEGRLPKSAAAMTQTAVSTSTKRKRLSQHRPAPPRSSYTLFTSGQLSRAMAARREGRPSDACPAPLPALPRESLLTVATFLSLRDVRALASSCRPVRVALAATRGAAEEIWMRRMGRAFPSVFRRVDPACLGVDAASDAAARTSRLDAELVEMRAEWIARELRRIANLTLNFDRAEYRRMTAVSSDKVNFVDDYRLPIPGLSDEDNAYLVNDGHDGPRDNDKVNLPLLVGLLPSRYPQKIDPATLVDRPRFGLQREGQKFRSYAVEIDPVRASVVQPRDGVQGGPSTLVPVVQFAGDVGTGDRCIRSDKPFPPNCIKVSCDCNHGACCSENCTSSRSFGGLSSWMRSRSPRTRKGRGAGRSDRHCGGAGDGGTVAHHGSLSAAYSLGGRRHRGRDAALWPSTPFVDHVRPTAASAAAPSPQSPLFRFISSLSHHCTSPASSFDAASSNLDDSRRSGNSSGGSDDEHGLNNYGTMVKHGLVSKCKQGLGKLRHYGGVGRHYSDCDGLRPFVVPTVIEEGGKGSSGGLVVDLTPRFVAYFEVTILRQGQDDVHQDRGEAHHRRPAHDRPNNDANVPVLQHRINAHQWNNHQHQQILRHMWRMPHRVVFPPMHLPLPLELDMDLRDGGGPRRLHAPPPVHGMLPRQRALNHANNNNNPDQQGQQRHECVAVGLSTRRFSPSDKMPGWDLESYGYHGDDGGIFHGRGDMLCRYGPSFGPGDTVGCGLEYSSRRVFFVKNGTFLGYAFGGIGGGNGGVGLSREVVDEGLYPTVGVDTTCPIFVNFGESPFRFDLKKFASSAGGAQEEG